MLGFKEFLEEAAKKPKWKRAGSDGEEEITLSNGKKFRLEKFYDENMRTGNIRHKGEWNVYAWNERRKEWEWGDTFSPKWFAKENVMKADT